MLFSGIAAHDPHRGRSGDRDSRRYPGRSASGKARYSFRFTAMKPNRPAGREMSVWL